MPSTIAEVDGTTFAGRFEGFARPLQVDAPEGASRREPVRLLPWTYGAHMAALRDCTYCEPEGLVLDRSRLATRVMVASGLAPEAHRWLAPLALWWAAGGADAAPPEAEDGRAELGATRARLRAWSEG